METNNTCQNCGKLLAKGYPFIVCSSCDLLNKAPADKVLVNSSSSGVLWQFIKTAAIVIAMGVLGLLATITGLIGTCTMITMGFSSSTWRSPSTLIFGIGMEAMAVALCVAVYFMYKSQLGSGRK